MQVPKITIKRVQLNEEGKVVSKTAKIKEKGKGNPDAQPRGTARADHEEL